jgi:molybdopterin-guanine dinucleotide biosynthesis protein A
MSGRVAGIVLAGGAGRRFGAPKGLVRLEDETLTARAVATLRPWCDEVIVVTRHDVPVAVAGSRTVFDRPGPAAPLAALATGLAAVEAEICLVLACDLPLAGPLVARLAGVASPAAVAVDRDGVAQPLCARYPRAAAIAACEALLSRGDLRARSLPPALGCVEVPADGDELRNVNTPDDLEAVRDRADPAEAD